MKKDIVFIDTSVFKANNYFSDTSKINKLEELASKGRISIVLTSITKTEIIRHLTKDIESARKSVRKRDNEVLRNIKGTDRYFSALDNLDAEKVATEKVNTFIKRSEAYVIDLKYCKDIEAIFYKYFKQEFPFSEKKQKEFPDAFALAALEGYNRNSGNKIIVLSTDPDMLNYRSDKLICKDYKKYISGKISEDIDLSVLYAELDVYSKRLKDKLKNDIENFLDDKSLYFDRIENGDLHNIDVKDIQVEFNSSDVYVDEINDQFIEFELEIHVDYKVGISYDDYTNAIYDNEDKEWYGSEYTLEDIIASGSTIVNLEFEKNTKDFEIKEADYSDLL